MASPLRDALSSRRALRQAVLLHEILGPPKSLRPGEELSSPPNGRPPIPNGEPRDNVDQDSGRNGAATRESDPPSGGGP
jgi:hypothetical protein